MAGPPIPAPVATYLERLGLTETRVVPLTGDASDRRYFRVISRGRTPFVLAVHAAPFRFEALPFVIVARLFASMPVPVPRILGHADDVGILALEDLGDVTLQAHLGAADPDEHDALYRRAVAIIDVFQRRGRDLADPSCLPYGVAFDVAKLTWELEFFRKHFLEAYRGAALTGSEASALAEEFAVLAEELAAEPRVLCHRDYHSRNLMLRDDELVVIDFQDARLGPDTYDLVSLLRDSYVDLPEAAVEALIGEFQRLQDRPGERDAFRRRFDVMALQRNLKALGTFGYQAAARANPVYIQYIPRTLALVADNLERHARFGRLREVLARHLDELGP